MYFSWTTFCTSTKSGDILKDESRQKKIYSVERKIDERNRREMRTLNCRTYTFSHFASLRARATPRMTSVEEARRERFRNLKFRLLTTVRRVTSPDSGVRNGSSFRKVKGEVEFQGEAVFPVSFQI